MEEKYTDLAVKIEGVDSRCKSNEHRIVDLEGDMKETKDMQITLVKLANGVENMGTQLLSVRDDLKEVKTGQQELSDKVTTLENKPTQESQKRIAAIIDKLIWLVVGGISLFLLTQMFPTIF